MAKRVSAREARAHFAEITDEVRYTGEPVIVEKQGRPFVAMISIEDLDALERMRREEGAVRRFTQHAKDASREYYLYPEPEDEDIVAAMKRTRAELYRQQYGGG